MNPTNTYHRDGTVTCWNAIVQQWEDHLDAVDLVRGVHRDVWRVMSFRDRARVQCVAEGRTLAEARALVGRIQRAADAGGTIQANQMLGLTYRPELHCCQTVESACRALGLDYVLDLA